MNYNFYNRKNILVTGGTGLIGIPVVQKLLEVGALVKVVSLDETTGINPDAEFIQGNLTNWEFCRKIVKNIDFVFHLAGTKGAVSTGRKKAASFFVPHLVFNAFMMEAARQAEVERYLYTSTIGIYPSAKIFKEENAWDGPPHETNYFAGWAKRMGELQAEAYKIEFNWDKIAIVRPANTYGPFDYFNSNSSMVIPSLIKRAIEAIEKGHPLVVWGDGSAIRDFVYSEDVAEGILLALEKGANCTPINLGSGVGYSIKELVETIISFFPSLEVKWDYSQPKGEDVRILDISRAQKILGYAPKTMLQEGIGKTIEWYQKNKNNPIKHYDVFHEKNLL